MKITVIGSGYVGLVTGACLAEMGNHVMCLDVDAHKVAMLEAGQVPIHEPGLGALIERNAQFGRIAFTTDAARAVAHGRMLFIAVGTPSGEDGSADLAHVLAAARSIAAHMDEYKVVVDKSTVPVGTADAVEAAIAEALLARGAALPFAVVSNPEFLKEGAAIDDFMKPDRVVVGTSDARAAEAMRAVYAPFLRSSDRLLLMDRRSAELTKYAANAMLACRISFMNEMAALAEHCGADIELVRRGLGSDPRIGAQFLYPGCGYGGSCFPKDVKALRHAGREAGLDLRILDAVEAVNDGQKQLLVNKVRARFGADLRGRRFALWGLAFKPGTDDMREAPSVVIARGLAAAGAEVVAYDPVAQTTARQALADVGGVRFTDNAMEAVAGADALLIATEWKEFRSPDFDAIRAALRQPVIFDGRNLFDPAALQGMGIEYHGIGRGVATVQSGALNA